MREIPEDVLFDRRLVDRHMAQGLLGDADLEKHMKQLPDATDLAASIDLDQLASRKSRQ